jgi:hypothetical protein
MLAEAILTGWKAGLVAISPLVIGGVIAAIMMLSAKK